MPEWLDEALSMAEQSKPAPPFVLTAEESKKVNQVAKRAAFKWQSVLVDDVEQTILLWCYSNPSKIESFRAKEFGMGSFVVSVKNVALKFCLKESKLAQGERLEDYSPNYDSE